MKDLSRVFECEEKAKRDKEERLRASAVIVAYKCCIESTPEEWIPYLGDLRLPLQPGLWLTFDEVEWVLYLERIKRNRQGKSRGTERSYANFHEPSALARQLREWGFSL